MHPQDTSPPSRPQRVERKIGEGIIERHARTCRLASGGKRCNCTPSYLARLKRGGVMENETFATSEEAALWRALRVVEHPAAAGKLVAPTLADAAASWVHRARDGKALTRSRRPFAPATVAGYERHLRLHVLDAIEPRSATAYGELRLSELGDRSCQALIDELAVSVGAETARTAAAVLAVVIRDAYDRGLSDQRPPRITRPPASSPRERVVTTRQADILIAAARADDEATGRSLLEPLVVLLEGSGVRISELLGLDWGPSGLDLEADPAILRVQRATTKSDAGVRVIPLDAATATVMRRHFLASARPAPGTPVFRNEEGVRLSRSGRVRSGLKRLATATGVNITPHVLRHSHATLLAASAVPMAALSARMGHGDASFTIRRYVHARPEDVAAIPNLLDTLKAARSTS